MKKEKWTALLLTAVLAVSLWSAGCSASAPGASSGGAPDSLSDSASDSADSPAEGDTLGLRSFSAVTLAGDSFTQDDLASKDLTVLNFWGTYCQPCIEEMPYLAKFAKALPENVQLITVCVDAQIAPDEARDLLAQAEFEGITLVDGSGDFSALLENVQAIPTTVFVDGAGNLGSKAVVGGGYDDYEEFCETFLSAVNGALKESGKAEISLAE